NTYSWTSSPTGFTSTSSNPTVTPTTTTTYTLTETITATGCLKSNTVTVIVNPLPSVNAGVDKSICTGGSTTIGTASTSGFTYAWTSSPSGFTSTVANPSVSPTTTTTYYLTQTNTTTTCNKADTVVITVNPLPSANAGAAKTICNGQSTSIGSTAVVGNTYSWTSSPSGFTSTDANPTVNPSTTTTYTLIETITATTCTKTNTVVITVTALPAKPTASSNSPLCVGATLNLAASTVTGATYNWTGPNSFSSTLQNPTIGSVTAIHAGKYYVYATLSSCLGPKDSTSIIINPLPAVNAGIDQSICTGGSTTIGTASAVGFTYTWTSSPSGFSSTVANPSVSPTTTTTYYLTQTNTTTTCNKADTVVITVNPLPAANAGTAKTICNGQSTSIGSTAVAGNTYSWTSSPTGFTSTSSNPTVTPTTTTTYTLTETITATGCTKSNTVTVTVNPLPAANSGSNISICNGQATSIGSTAVSGNTYSWTSSPSGFTSTISNPTVSPATSTTYTLTETITATGCLKSNSVTVTVNPLPAANVGSNDSICYGKSITIGSTAVVGNTYSWTSSPSGFSSTVANPTVSPTTTTTFTLMEIITATGCTKSNSVTIKVNPFLSVSMRPSKFICYGASTIIKGSGSGGSGGFTYSWSPTTALSTPTNDSTTANPTSTTVYTLTVKDAKGCTVTGNATVTVNPKLTVKADTSKIICKGGSTTLVATPTGGTSGYTYLWIPSTGLSSTSINKPIAKPIVTTTYKIMLTDTMLCTAKDSVLITVLPPVAANSIIKGQYICYNTSANITGSTPTGGNGSYTYQWQDSISGGSWNNISGATSQSYTATGLIKTTYYRRIVSSGACTGKQLSLSNFDTITVNPKLNAYTKAALKYICYNTSTTLIDSSYGGTGTITFSWTSSPSGFTSSIKNPSTGNLTSTTRFYLKVTDSKGCTDTTSILIKVNPKLIAAITSTKYICYNTSTILDASGSNGGTTPYGYTWSSNPTGFSSTLQKPSSGNLKANTRFYLTLTDAKGCTDTISIFIKVNLQMFAKATALDTVLCYDHSTTLAAACKGGVGNYSYAWSSTPSGFTSSFQKVSSGNLPSSIRFNLKVTDSLGCTDTAGVFIKVNPLPIVKAGKDINVCINDSVSILSGYSPLKGYWRGTGIIDSVKGIFKPSKVGVGSYQMIYYFQDPVTKCENTDTMFINVRPLPVIGFTNDTLRCKFDSVAFTNITTGAVTYIWKFGDGDSSILKSPNHQYKAKGNYKITLIASSFYGCKDTTFGIIRIAEIPLASFSKILDSGCAPLVDSFINKSTGEIQKYLWDFGNTITSNLKNPTFKQSNLIDSIYYIKLTVSNFCGANTFTDSVKVKPKPIADFVLSQDSGCSPLNIAFYNLSKGISKLFFWDLGNGKTTTRKFPFNQTYLADTTDTVYHITLRVKNACGTDSFKRDLLVHPQSAFANFKVNTSAGCDPLTISITNYSRGNTFLSWNFGDGNVSSAQNPKHTYTAAGKYNLTQYVNNGCSYDTMNQVISVYAKPYVYWQPNSHQGCTNTLINFSNQSTNTSNVIWDFGDGDTSILFSPSHQYKKAGRYLVKLTGISNAYSCNGYYSDSIIIDAIPNTKIILDTFTGCQPLDVKILNTPQSYTYYSWNFGDGNTSALSNPTHTYKDSGNYQITLFAQNIYGCKDTGKTKVYIFPKPTSGFTMSKYKSCDLPTQVDFINQSKNANSFVWYFQNHGTSFLNNPTIIYDTPGVYTNLLVSSNSFGCNDTSSQKFVLYHKPKPDFSMLNNKGCVPLTVRFFNTSAYADSFHYSFGDGLFSDSANNIHTYYIPGVYTVNLKVKEDGICPDSTTKKSVVIVYNKPDAGFTYAINYCDDNLHFESLTSGDVVNCSWDFGDGEHDNTNCNPIHNYFYDGKYTVSQTVVNKYGCEDTTSRKIDVINDHVVIRIPNVFTPKNNDTINNTFQVVCSNVEPFIKHINKFNMKIYSRWGELVFESSDITKGWDGTFQGRDAQEGVYIYLITTDCENKKYLKGNVSLLR
ncbi:MAG: PKD domain-containing protein, partial [Bacteroidetes bacterium]|nr:PKD domain-containing protein [Bacteroidota bacterium]